MDHFYIRISSVMEDLIVGIVALGILVVSLEYVQLYIDFRADLNIAHLAQRFVLFLTVIAFTAYYFVAYSAYFASLKTTTSFADHSALRFVVMYLLDLMAITVSAWLYAVLLIGTLTSTPDTVAQDGKLIELMIREDDMNAVFAIMTAWHAIILVWYFAARGDLRDKVIHLGFLLVYTVLTYITSQGEGGAIVWGYILVYLALIIGLYAVKGLPDIKASIASQNKANST